MSALRSALQKTVFQQDEERLIDVVQIVPHDGKKHKKEAYMCLAMTIEQPFSVRLYVIKADRDMLRKREKFALRDVRVVDGINPRKAIPEFTMKILEQDFVLITSTYEEKEKFIRQLYKFSNQYLPVHKPEFINIQLPVDIVPVSQASEQNEVVITENLPISAKEEADFRNLLSKANLTIGDAKKFAVVLNEKLLELDGANIESIMGNEHAVVNLINLVDGALEEVNSLEQQLNELDNILLFVRDSVELIEEKDSLGQVERENTERLRRELEEFIFHLNTISDDHIQVLRDARLSDPASINQCCIAARAMNNFLNKKTELSSMAAYQSRVVEINQVRNEFVDKLFSHISALFDRMETMVEDQEWDSLILQIQTQRHRALSPFAELVAWLKATSTNAYNDAIRRYISRAEILYRKEFKRFFTAINQRVATLAGKKDSGGANNAVDQAYISLLETIMGEARNAVEAEQKFCVRFFQISADLLNTVETRSSESGDSGGVFSVKTVERQFNDQVKNVIQPIFCSFMPCLSEFIELCGKQSNLVLLLLYVTLSKKLHTHHDTGSYFTVIYGSSMILFKQRIDQLMQEVARGFENYRPAKKTRVGILPIIAQFENLARHCEGLFENSERRTDLEKWHEKLVDALFKGINGVSDSSYSKSPASVVRFENFHQLYLTLSGLKIECLDGRRKESKKIYQMNVDNYVREYMGRPLEKIHIFFEQIERAIDGGVRPEEIGYQQQFSRIELKKVLSAYPGKEVKKGLENLYKKVEKHLVDGSLLIEVVWRQMQEEFLKQLKVYQQMMAKCYPNARMDLEMLRNKLVTGIGSVRYMSEIPTLKDKPVQDYRNLRAVKAVYGCGLTKTGSLATSSYVEKRSSPESISCPVRIGYCVGKKIKKIASGFGFSLFASSNELYGSGLNNFYQLGGPINDDNHKRTEQYYIGGKRIVLPENSGKIVDIAAGRLHSLVATTSKVYAFGDNAQGQCGRNPEKYPFVTHSASYAKLRHVNLPDGAVPKKVHCSLDTSFVLLEDGRLFSFGLNADGQTGSGSLETHWIPNEVQGDVKGEHIVDVAGSADTLMAVNRNGDVFAWGLNEYGQLHAVTDEIQVDFPRILNWKLGKVVSVAATGSSCILCTSEGLAYSWGGQILGFGPEVTTLDRPMLLDPPLFSSAVNNDGRVKRVFAGCYSMGVLTSEGNFFIWGMNRYGSLGLGHSDDQLFPFQVFVPEQIKTVSLGPDHSLFLTQ